jgi:hypothetical protein
MTAALVRYDAMCRAIAAAYQVDEVKDIRDRALAIQMYARQADNTEAERQACEIRLRAERKAGQLLKEIEKAKGARQPGTNRGATPLNGVRASTMADWGVSYKQSSDWQKLAEVPEAQFEAALAGPNPTTAGIIEAAKPKPITPVSSDALWLWGRLRDFERDTPPILSRSPQEFLATMTSSQIDDVLRLAPLVAAWLDRVEETDETRRRRAEVESYYQSHR